MHNSILAMAMLIKTDLEYIVGILARYGARLVLLMSVIQHTLTSLTPVSHLNPAAHAIKVEWVRGVVFGKPRIVVSFRSSIPTTALKPLKLGLSVRGCCW
jgi:hypothetical protein